MERCASIQLTVSLTVGFLVAMVSAERLYVNLTGDIMLGALFPIHKRGPGAQICNGLQTDDGIQPLEALLYTVDRINQNDEILPGIQLGVLGFDTCDSVSKALEESLDFVKGFISHINEHHNQEFHCNDGSAPSFRGGAFDRVVGVIGGQSSSVSIQVATLLRLFKIPQISYLSTSTSLSNRERFPYFFRTVPSDINQAQAILEVLRRFNWTYVAVVYSDSEYGVHGFETLRELAANYSVCFTIPQRIIRDQFNADDYEQVIAKIKAKPLVRVVVVYAEKATTQLLMRAAGKQGVKGRFVWVGSDAWSSRDSVVQGQEETLEGAIAVQPLVRRLSGFDDYFTSLSPANKTSERNPWFREFWEKHFQCRLDPEAPEGESSVPECNETSRIDSSNGYRQQAFLHFVRDSVYAFANAVHNMHMVYCNGERGLCDRMKHIEGEELKGFLNNVTFKGEVSTPCLGSDPLQPESVCTLDVTGHESDNTFRFVNGGDGPPRYSVVNFQRDGDTLNYSWKVVGNYSMGEDGQPELIMDEISLRFRSDEEEFPASTCTQPCKSHQVQVREGDDTCCWQCRSCGKYQFRQNNSRCVDCPLGFAPTEDHSQCAPMPEVFVDYQNPWAIGAMAFAGLGILVTVFVALIFWLYNDTPIIKAAGRELSYLLLLGILLSFGVTFVIVARPTDHTCGLSRFFLGFCYTLTYAAIVTKTNRIARIFNHKTSTPHKTKYTSPKSQMIIMALLTSVEILINICWLLYDPPAFHVLMYRDTRLRICEGVENYSYLVGLLYPFVLIGFCTIYAIKTRKCPGGFNETRYIAFTNYTTLIIWLAFVPLYLASTNSSIRVVTLAISLSLSALVQLGCLFFPKIYIVILKPEKNTKEVVMAQHRSSSYVTPPSNNTSLVIANGVESQRRSQMNSMTSEDKNVSPNPIILHSLGSRIHWQSDTQSKCDSCSRKGSMPLTAPDGMTDDSSSSSSPADNSADSSPIKATSTYPNP